MRRVRNGAWILLFVFSLVVALFSIGAVITGVEENEFENSTEISWHEVEVTSPSIASYIIRLERLIGVGYGVIGFTWAAVAFGILRNRKREGWLILWGMPLTFGGASAVFFVHQARGLGIYYGVLSLLALVALLLSYPGIERDV